MRALTPYRRTALLFRLPKRRGGQPGAVASDRFNSNRCGVAQEPGERLRSNILCLDYLPPEGSVTPGRIFIRSCLTLGHAEA